jgi:hypothetical protein
MGCIDNHVENCIINHVIMKCPHVVLAVLHLYVIDNLTNGTKSKNGKRYVATYKVTMHYDEPFSDRLCHPSAIHLACHLSFQNHKYALISCLAYAHMPHHNRSSSFITIDSLID